MYRIPQLSMLVIAISLLSVNSPIWAADLYQCHGFDYPMDAVVTIAMNERRLALPLRATLLDGEASIVTSADLVLDEENGIDNRPVVQVMFYDEETPPEDAQPAVIEQFLPQNESDDGISFTYMPLSGEWHFKLSARPFDVAGTYVITMLSSNTELYQFDSNYECISAFVRVR